MDEHDGVSPAANLTIVAHWRHEPLRPFGALGDVIDDLAARIQGRQPELLQRFRWFLVNLLYPWRRSAATVPVGELRAGLADLALRGDQTLIHQFFQKRNVRPQMLSYCVQFVLESVAAIAAEDGSPVVVCLEDAQLADELTLSALRMLNRYARYSRSALRLYLTSTRAIGDGFEDWQIVAAPPASALTFAPDTLSDTQREALAIATTFALPFTAAEWSALLPERLRHVLPSADAGARDASTQAAAIGPFVNAGALRQAGDDRLRFATARAREMCAGALDAGSRVAAHRQLQHSEAFAERDDPFAAAWHAHEAGTPAERLAHNLDAMQRAWAVSSYDCAIAYAERALAAQAQAEAAGAATAAGAADVASAADAARAPDAGGAPHVNADLLRGLLHYEAERYTEAHAHLAAAVENPPVRLGRTVVEYLLGYNAVFGLNDFPRGIEILERVLKDYERTGDQRGAAYIRNSLAFAHFRSRHLDEAIDLEAENIDLIARANVSDSFLASILQLNLGRIYRTQGEADRALQLFRKGLNVRRGEPTSHVLLLFYATLAGLEFARGDHRASLAACHHALELVRDMQLDSVKDQVMQAWARGIPELPQEQMTRGDELRFYLHVHAGQACARLGLHDRAEAYLAMIRHQRDLLGDAVVRAVEAAFDKHRLAATAAAAPASAAADTHDSALPQSSTEPSVAAAVAAADPTEALDAIAAAIDLLRMPVEGGDTIDAVADAILDGQTVAISRTRAISSSSDAATSTIDCVMLYDPRHAEIPERMTAEVGGSHIPRGMAVVALPDATPLFADAVCLPLVQQTVALRPEHRATYAALVPVRLCVQVLTRETDGWLFDVAGRVAARGGPPMLGAAPYHLWRRDLAVTPAQAIQSFLVSSIDALVLGDRLLQKRHGTNAVQNLSAFRPRLSEEALVYTSRKSNAAPGHEPLLVRIKRRGGYATDELLKLHPSMRTMLDLCDGRHTIEELLDRLQPGPQRVPGGAGDERICTFLRTLWQRGALCFDESPQYEEPREPSASLVS